ncbi:MAG TPA: head-tail adaptor protein [Urbifossiella sp.]|nr:head-tail adaptor protein [Urbifossiella sp.]
MTHKITMRYRTLTTADRLVYGSRVFIIKEVLNVNEDSRFLQIKALEQA